MHSARITSCPPPLPLPFTEPFPRTAPALRTGALAGAASVVLLALVAVRWSPLTALDRSVAEALHRHAVADPGLVRVNRVLTDWVWDPWTMRALIAVAVVVLWWRGRVGSPCGWPRRVCSPPFSSRR